MKKLKLRVNTMIRLWELSEFSQEYGLGNYVVDSRIFSKPPSGGNYHDVYFDLDDSRVDEIRGKLEIVQCREGSTAYPVGFYVRSSIPEKDAERLEKTGRYVFGVEPKNPRFDFDFEIVDEPPPTTPSPQQ